MAAVGRAAKEADLGPGGGVTERRTGEERLRSERGPATLLVGGTAEPISKGRVRKSWK